MRIPLKNVGKTIINHPPNHHLYRWYVYHSQSWVVYGIVLPTLPLNTLCKLTYIAIENCHFVR